VLRVRNRTKLDQSARSPRGGAAFPVKEMRIAERKETLSRLYQAKLGYLRGYFMDERGVPKV
jgi:hypothetical protein